MTSHSMDSADFVDFTESKLPWGNEIWHEDGDWFTMAQLLWVKLFGSTMSYGQLHYIVSSPLFPMGSFIGQNSNLGNQQAYEDRCRIFEMELVMDPARGILLIGEVYGRPGDRVWQPEKIYGQLLELGVVLTEFFQRELLGERAAVFCPGYALILRDMERSHLAADSPLNQLNTVTRDELRSIRHHIDCFMDERMHEPEIPFHTYGHVLISALRNISHNSQGELGGFRTAEEIYSAPRLPAWLRA